MSDYPSTEQILSEVSAEKTAQTPEVKPEVKEQGPSWQEDEYEIEGGKRVKEPREMILKRASLGYHAAQKLQYANQMIEKYKGYDERIAQLQRWQEYNDFAEKNPAWAEHVQRSWEQRQNMQQLNQENPQGQFQLPPEIAAKLEKFEKITDDFANKEQQLKIEAEDKQLDDEIASVAKQYGVDLSEADEQGRSLEWQVLEHAKALGLDLSKPGQFRAAFKDYRLDYLLERQKEQGKEQVAKTIEDHRKVGILGVSRTPKASKAFNAADYSYDQLAEMAKRDMAEARKA